MSKLEIKGDGVNAEFVKLDGLDITNMVSGITVNIQAGKLYTADVGLIIDSFEIEPSEMIVTINGEKHLIGNLEPLYDLLKSHFEVAQALEGRVGKEPDVNLQPGEKLALKGRIV